MNPFVTRIRGNDSWVLPVTGMSLVLGVMISMAWVTDFNRTSRFSRLEPSQRARVSEATLDIEAYQSMSTEVEKLRSEKTKLEEALTKGTGATKLLNDSLQETKMFAGLTPLEGPGVQVTLQDSREENPNLQGQGVVVNDSNIHDTDVVLVVNELNAAGAEGIAVNDMRIAGSSSCRCVGNTILVNDVKVSSPIVIRAIGDPNTLYGALNINEGLLDKIRAFDPSMVSISKVKKMILPAYAGGTTLRLGKVPKETK